MDMGININHITIANIDECNGLRIDKDEMLEPHPDCCIYKVPKDLRRVNEEAYTPQVISIGPLHHGKNELLDMEEQKVRYKREFSKRISGETLQELITFIEEHEQRIRNCYEEMPKFEKLEFITMILYDGIFIIELFLRYHENKKDFLLSKAHISLAIWLDLQLLENQLPHFILKKLYMLAFPKTNPDPNIQSYPSFLELSCAFLSSSSTIKVEIPEEVEAKHFVDLRRHAITKTHPKPNNTRNIEDLPCALELKKSGVKFKGTSGNDLIDIKFEKKNLFGIPWSMKVRDELQIPRIEVVDSTEHLIRNVMALEQCHYPSDAHVCSYIDLMDNLINTEQDVNLLIKAGIISNHVGDTARIANMFNKLGQHIVLSSSCYGDIVKDLKAHYESPWNHARATLKKVYFSNPWRGTGTVAAIVLLLLTLIQTVCSILQVVGFV